MTLIATLLLASQPAMPMELSMIGITLPEPCYRCTYEAGCSVMQRKDENSPWLIKFPDFGDTVDLGTGNVTLWPDDEGWEEVPCD